MWLNSEISGRVDGRPTYLDHQDQVDEKSGDGHHHIEYDEIDFAEDVKK